VHYLSSFSSLENNTSLNYDIFFLSQGITTTVQLLHNIVPRLERIANHEYTDIHILVCRQVEEPEF